MSDTGSLADRAGQWGAGLADRAVDKSSDWWWEMQGGPWLAQYHHFATLIAIGVFEGEPHSEHFMDPAEALKYFRQPMFDRYRNDPTLRGACKITYGPVIGWYMVEPFAADADHKVDVMRAEVADAERRGATRGKRWAEPNDGSEVESIGTGWSGSDAGGSA